jgi:hypothetical protein
MNEEQKVYIGTAVAILSLIIAGWVGFSHFEAKAFNEATGKHVTTVQAMFLQLRIQEPSK